MKKKLITLTFTILLSFASVSMNAQTDAFFTNGADSRTTSGSVSFNDFSGQYGQGFSFNSFNNQDGLSFNGLNSDGAPITNGLLILSATGMLYMITKRRKENKQ